MRVLVVKPENQLSEPNRTQKPCLQTPYPYDSHWPTPLYSLSSHLIESTSRQPQLEYPVQSSLPPEQHKVFVQATELDIMSIPGQFIRVATKSEIWYIPMEANIDLSKISPTLFLDFTAQSLTYLLRPCKEAGLIEEIINAGNGAIVNEVGLYTITLMSPDEDYDGDEEVFSTKYIEDCARKNKQLNLNNYRRSIPKFAWRESGKHLGKTTLTTPDQDSNINLSVLGSLFYSESSTLDHAATKAGQDAPILITLQQFLKPLTPEVCGVVVHISTLPGQFLKYQAMILLEAKCSKILPFTGIPDALACWYQVDGGRPSCLASSSLMDLSPPLL
uniref:Uncharacterized protein n=1 Tax=Timema shepardi TaxID=629360 RepID=A0A7R9G1K9_TIMSH|nr:unnamed protein product [Timema shepardi]